MDFFMELFAVVVRITNLRSFSNQSQNPAIYSTEESGLVKVLFSFREFHS